MMPIITVLIIIITLIATFLHTNVRLAKEDLSIHDSTEPGKAGISRQKIFIVSALYERQGDWELGPWVQSLLDLIETIGPEDVFLSIHENGPSQLSVTTFQKFSELIMCTNFLAQPIIPFRKMLTI